ncbi:AHH domain-containing protein [Kitasatospora sp. NPDC004240]
MTPGGGTLTIRPHPPEAVTFDGAVDGRLRPALEEVLLRAVARVVEGLQPADLQTVGALPAGPAPLVAAPFVAVPEAAPERGEWVERAEPSEPSEPSEAFERFGRTEPAGALRLSFTLPADLLTDAAEPATEETAVPAEPGPGPQTGEPAAGEPGAEKVGTGEQGSPAPAPVAPRSPRPGRGPAPATRPAAPAPGSAAGQTPEAAPASAREPQSAQEPRSAQEPGATPEPQAPPDEAGEVRDEVIEGPSGLEGAGVMVLPGTRIIALGGAPRHVVASTLARALQLGRATFGRTSFALLEGPVGARDSRIRAVATDPPLTNEDVKQTTELPAGMATRVVEGRFPSSVRDTSGHRHDVLAVLTREHNVALFADREVGRRFYGRLAAEGPELSEEELRARVLDELDRLVEQGLAGDEAKLAQAAERLAELGAEAFELAGWPTKTAYLEVLVKVWTMERHERAIVEIMRSLQSVSELRAVMERLREAGIATRMFEDLGPAFWDLLVTVGERFGSKEKLTVEVVRKLFEEAFALEPRPPSASLSGWETVEEALAGLGERLENEIDAAVGAVEGLLAGMIDGLKMLVTEPDQVVVGLAQLARMLALFELAGWGNKAAQAECAVLVRHIGAKLVAGLRGAAVLNVGEKVFARIRWALAVEVASWFIGIGELKAAAEAVGLTEKLTLLARLLGLAGAVARTTEGEAALARLSRLARALHSGSAVLRELKGESEVLRLLEHLPAEDVEALAAVVKRVEIAEGATLAQLAGHPELGPVVERVHRRAEILQTFAAKSGGLVEELGPAFRRLVGPGGFEEREIAAMAQALRPGEGGNFLAALERIGYRRIGPTGEVGAEFLTALAASPRAMDGVRVVGPRVVQAAFARSAGDAAVFEAILLDIARAEDMARQQRKLGTFATVLERLEAGDTEAWARIAGAKAVLTKVERSEVLARIRSIRQRYRRLARDPEKLDRQLNHIRDFSRKDPERAMGALERFEARSPDRAGALSIEEQLARDLEEADLWATEEEKLLLHPAGEVPPQALDVGTQRHKRTGTDRPTEAMRRNMPGPHPPGHPLHHIVEEGDPRSEMIRRILDEAGIDVREAEANGIHLPRTTMDPGIVPEALTLHPPLHTKGYRKEQVRRLAEARRTGTVEAELARFKREIQEGQFFHIESAADKRESWVDWVVRHRDEFDHIPDDEFEEWVESMRRARPSGER